ncbi:MAG TPA: DNA primase [Kineosporiaceae bacterium]|nr:DNA primase [Kineosporiaceae bacterium]
MRIRREDVETVRDESKIEDVVGEQVALRPAGVGSLKGLCPFHDEKSPSFHVRPTVGLYHCFGCGEGGDVISFVQKVDHLAFAEAVERLAARLGMELRYEDDGGKGAGRREQVGQRQRLIDANRVAAAFFEEQLGTLADAGPARQFLAERGFDQAAAAQFGVGFAPRGGEVLLRHLRAKGFAEEELLASGLAGQGRRGLYDRFRGRLLWPIRDVTGDTVGFGARRIFDDDGIEAKYLNTPETAIYHKSQLLYGVDLAKREISTSRQVVVVEGYTDVMACHLAGVGTAVATCGTAFGADHIRVVRRLIGDDTRAGGKVIFTFDGDGAGQKAALKAYEDDQRFVAQTYIALAPDGMDPCDLRLRHGDEAVRELITARQPLFEFKIRSELKDVELHTAEGRVAGLRKAAPVVAQIRDPSLRPEYARQLAGWLGMEIESVTRAVNQALRHPPGGADGNATKVQRENQRQPEPAQSRPTPPRPDDRDPVVGIERQALECLLQVPRLVPAVDADALENDAFQVPAYRAVHSAVRAAGGMAVAAGLSGPAWVKAVQENAPDAVEGLINELAVTPLPADREEALAKYAAGVVLGMAEMIIIRRIGDLRSRVQRMGADGSDAGALAELVAAEAERRALRERIYS